jgi:hypothetical protein
LSFYLKKAIIWLKFFQKIRIFGLFNKFWKSLNDRYTRYLSPNGTFKIWIPKSKDIFKKKDLLELIVNSIKNADTYIVGKLTFDKMSLLKAFFEVSRKISKNTLSKVLRNQKHICFSISKISLFSWFYSQPHTTHGWFYQINYYGLHKPNIGNLKLLQDSNSHLLIRQSSTTTLSQQDSYNIKAILG